MEELRGQLRSLKTLLIATLAVLVLLGASLNTFILRQVSAVRKQAGENQRFVDDYNKVSAPLISDFLAKLTVYSKTNADIARLLAKYNLQQMPVKPGATTQTGPATVPKN